MIKLFLCDKEMALHIFYILQWCGSDFGKKNLDISLVSGRKLGWIFGIQPKARLDIWYPAEYMSRYRVPIGQAIKFYTWMLPDIRHNTKAGYTGKYIQKKYH